MRSIDKALEILQATKDGSDLAPVDMALVQLAVNGNLSEHGVERFESLYQAVKGRTYVQPWFHGIEHLLRLQGGVVTWKGVEVEHYTFTNVEREREAALRLASTCQMLEEKGVPVNSRTAISSSLFEDMPAKSEWIPILATFYTAFSGSDGKCKHLVMHMGQQGTASVAISVIHDTPVMVYEVDPNGLACVSLYRRLEAEGFKSCVDRLQTYGSFVECMGEAGIRPDHVQRVLAAGLPADMTGVTPA